MPRKILLIDDDRLQFRLTQQWFKAFVAHDYVLEWQSTYEEGLRALMEGDYIACLLDYRLGQRDGLELIREATELGCRVPIIFLTAETGAAVDIQAMNSGALDYLVKGEINAAVLERSLRYALKLGDTLEALRQLATRDELTGLLNRRVFDQTFDDELERAKRFGRSFAMIMLDIDHFKQVNDTHGHPTGDVVLAEVARRLQSRVRSVDRVMRYGGEEFAVLMFECDVAMALDLANRLCADVRQVPIEADKLTLSVTISAGIAMYPAHGQTKVALVKAADGALYAAKTAGRDRAVLAGDPEPT
jgi:two-component system, cell cycle response regulator